MVRDSEKVAAFFGTLDSWDRIEGALDELGWLIGGARRCAVLGSLDDARVVPGLGALGVERCGGGVGDVSLFTRFL